MKTTPYRVYLVLITLLIGVPSLFAQEENEEVPEWRRKFENLDPNMKKKFSEQFLEANRLFRQKRIFEAINAINEAEKIHKDLPDLLNLKGACYVEFRDFEPAQNLFQKAAEIVPDNADITFNLAEIFFVTEKWPEAETSFTKALDLLPEDKRIQMRRLIEFKLLLVKIRLQKNEEVETLAAKYGFDDDSPFHYYSQSALAYERDDRKKAEEWLRIARRIFRQGEALTPWQDTMIEFGYIESFYGGDLEDAGVPNAEQP